MCDTYTACPKKTVRAASSSKVKNYFSIFILDLAGGFIYQCIAFYMNTLVPQLRPAEQIP